MLNEGFPIHEKQPISPIPSIRKFIRAVKITGAVAIPILFMKGDAQLPVYIVDSLVDPANAAEIDDTNRSLEQTTENPRESAKNLLINYLNSPHEINVENEPMLDILNNPNTTSNEYATALENLPTDKAIFPFLKSRNAKLRFIEAVIAKDDLDTRQYQTPDYGQDVDGDGKIELTLDENKNTINEAGEIVDTTSFVCDDYSRELSLRYGIQNTTPLRSLKYQMPMLRTEINEGYVDTDDRKAWGRGHAFNAVFLGENSDDLKDISNWHFIEPQSDESVNVPIKHLIDGRILTLSIPHVDNWNTGGDSLESFLLMPDGSLQLVDDMTLQIIESIQSWFYMNKYPATFNGEFRDDLMSDEPDLLDYSPDSIYQAARLSIQSRYLDYNQVTGALNDSTLPPEFNFAELFKILDEVK